MQLSRQARSGRSKSQLFWALLWRTITVLSLARFGLAAAPELVAPFASPGLEVCKDQSSRASLVDFSASVKLHSTRAIYANWLNASVLRQPSRENASPCQS